MLSCENQETCIYQLERFSETKEINGIIYSNEVFIIANFPRNKSNLLRR